MFLLCQPLCTWGLTNTSHVLTVRLKVKLNFLMPPIFLDIKEMSLPQPKFHDFCLKRSRNVSVCVCARVHVPLEAV